MTIQKATREFMLLHNAWSIFRNSVDHLAIMQEELLGRNLNQMTTTFENLYNVIAGNVQPGISPEQEMALTVTRAEVIKKLLDHMSEQMK